MTKTILRQRVMFFNDFLFCFAFAPCCWTFYLNYHINECPFSPNSRGAFHPEYHTFTYYSVIKNVLFNYLDKSNHTAINCIFVFVWYSCYSFATVWLPMFFKTSYFVFNGNSYMFKTTCKSVSKRRQNCHFGVNYPFKTDHATGRSTRIKGQKTEQNELLVKRIQKMIRPRFFSSSPLCHYRRWQGVTICWVQTDSSLLQLYCRAGLNTGFSGHLISPLPLFYLSTETSLNFLYTKPTRNVKLSGVQGLLRLYCELGSTGQISVWILNHCKNLNMSHIEITSTGAP